MEPCCGGNDRKPQLGAENESNSISSCGGWEKEEEEEVAAATALSSSWHEIGKDKLESQNSFSSLVLKYYTKRYNQKKHHGGTTDIKTTSRR